MVKKSKIKPTSHNLVSSKIKPTEFTDTEKVSFNFRRLHEKTKKFNYTIRDRNYFCTLIERLKNVSGMNKIDVVVRNSKQLKCHKIDFADKRVTESSFGILGEDIDEDAWQFQLTKNEHGRVHGYFIENVFYVVWLDPMHQLYK